MSQQQINWKCFLIYFLGIFAGTLLCLWLPETFQRQLAIYRLVSEDTFLQQYTFKQLLFLYFPKRLFILGLLLTVSMIPGDVFKGLISGYAGILLSVTISVLTLFYSQFGILYTIAVAFPQCILYGYVLYQLIWRVRNHTIKQQIAFRCVLIVIWIGGIFLEILFQGRLLRYITLFLSGK